MLKEVGYIILGVAIGLAAFNFLVAPYFRLASITDMLTNLQPPDLSSISTIMTFINEHLTLITGTLSAVGVIGGILYAWYNKAKAADIKQEMESKLLQSNNAVLEQYNKNLDLAKTNLQLGDTVKTLQTQVGNTSDLLAKVEAQAQQIQNLSQMNNQLSSLIPNQQTYEEWQRKLEEATKVQ